jgi:hypothetical protein
MLIQVVESREAIVPFAIALVLRAVDKTLVMRRLVVSAHIRFAREVFDGLAALV